jgi:hypothetical protein
MPPTGATPHAAPLTAVGATPTQCASASPAVGVPAGVHDLVAGSVYEPLFEVNDPGSSVLPGHVV